MKSKILIFVLVLILNSEGYSNTFIMQLMNLGDGNYTLRLMSTSDENTDVYIYSSQTVLFLKIPPGSNPTFSGSWNTNIIPMANLNALCGGGINFDLVQLELTVNIDADAIPLGETFDLSDFFIDSGEGNAFAFVGNEPCLPGLGVVNALQADLDGQGGSLYDSESQNLVGETTTTLPLNLMSFEVQKYNETSASLKWEITNEKSLNVFEIYRSTPGARWTYVSTVKNDHMLRNTSFDYIDENVYNGGENVHFYYKLKIYDQDGRYYYSNIEMVSFDPMDAIDELVLYPNPTSGELNFTLDKLDQDEAILLEIYDIEGKLIYRDNRIYSGVKNRVYDVDALNLKSGVYQLIVEDNLKNRYYKKFVYQK
jgi:hypothetical protein